MAERLRVVVEQDDIDRGVPGDAECCPVARAIRRLRPGEDVYVGMEAIYVGDCGAIVPGNVALWIWNFDDPGIGPPVECGGPFGFVLELEPETEAAS